jgi:hypothetical protein
VLELGGRRAGGSAFLAPNFSKFQTRGSTEQQSWNANPSPIHSSLARLNLKPVLFFEIVKNFEKCRNGIEK